ncbi:putative histidine--tRNA ligase [Plasmodium gaboni]|uniref:histidine--tRNA ligase n=1 Tax=Plasmodium gaboni TaxID=647221 RepID=A0A151LMB7_9APIC|nr:putative histidine--tRNA ligase [Plasmodium gaboni]KYO00318.1 putative histidine--tRNA ligase [Plasmodium gaboni]
MPLLFFILLIIYLHLIICRKEAIERKHKSLFLNNTLLKKNNIKRCCCKINKKRIFSVQYVKGIRNFINPTNYEKREYLFNIWKQIANNFSFDFYDLPILESYDLFRKSPINESYDFIKNNKHLILRPEITPQLIRYLYINDNLLQGDREEENKIIKSNDDNNNNNNNIYNNNYYGDKHNYYCQQCDITNKVNRENTHTNYINKYNTNHSSFHEQNEKCKHSVINSNNGFNNNMNACTSHFNENIYKKKKILKYQNINKIFKMCTIGQCFRYEQTSRLRKREHYQWNLDILGIENIYAEIELLCMLIMFFNNVNMDDKNIVIKLNHKYIIEYIIYIIFQKDMNNILSYNKIKNEIKKLLHILDKFYKINKSTFKLLLYKNFPYIQKETIRHLYNVLKNIKHINHLEQFVKCHNTNIYYNNIDTWKHLKNFKNIFNYFEQTNLNNYFKLDLTIVRGMDYYNNMVFEIYYKKDKSHRAICGGGRYNFFLNDNKIYAVGCAMGDVVITDLLFNNKKNNPFLSLSEQNKINKYIHVVSYFPYFHNITQNNNNQQIHSHTTNLYKEYYNILNKLRNNNIIVNSILKYYSNLSKVIKKAIHMNAKHILFFSKDNNSFILKNLKTKEQKFVTSDNILDIYNNYISTHK